MLGISIGLALTQASAQSTDFAAEGVKAPTEIAAGIFVYKGHSGPASASNQARLANIALVEGPNGAIVWNTGVSHRHGQLLISAMLSQIDVPIRSAVISHAYQDVLFGWSAFSEIDIDVLMHQSAVTLMHKRCQGCIDRLTELLGPEKMIGTELAEPSTIITGPVMITSIGRRLQILDAGFTSGPNDLMLFDEQTSTLFAGGAVMTDTIIEVRDGRIESWIDALKSLSDLPIELIVPDYGDIGDKHSVEATVAYLQGLQDQVSALLKRGVTLSDAVENAAMPEYKDWPGYEEHHGRNVHQLYLNMESRFFE